MFAGVSWPGGSLTASARDRRVRAPSGKTGEEEAAMALDTVDAGIAAPGPGAPRGRGPPMISHPPSSASGRRRERSPGGTLVKRGGISAPRVMLGGAAALARPARAAVGCRTAPGSRSSAAASPGSTAALRLQDREPRAGRPLPHDSAGRRTPPTPGSTARTPPARVAEPALPARVPARRHRPDSRSSGPRTSGSTSPGATSSCPRRSRTRSPMSARTGR